MESHQLSFPKLLLACLICSSTFLFFATFGQSATTAKLHTQEVNVLKEIGKKLGKKDWDFGKDPCTEEGNWTVPISTGKKGFDSAVICDCTFNHNSSCHVIRIFLKSQNLSGTVPPEFSKLPYLEELDLSRNVLNGTIPSQWATMRLHTLSFMGNRLSGPFPKVLTNITTLRNLSIEGNHFSGPIPWEIGKLIKLEKLILSSNAFTGKLPSTLGKLTNLSDMRINDNNFSGKIPDFIGNWTRVSKLLIEGSSLEGPIPSTISALTSLTDLRITDLKGNRSPFPPLRNLESLKTLILRNCLIHGEIPDYIGDMENLKNLDLSFNELTGEIPASFVRLEKIDIMYLTGNQLNGTIPGWVPSSNNIVYLKFRYTGMFLTTTSLGKVQVLMNALGEVNLVESYSSSADKLKIQPCMKRNFPCHPSKDQRKISIGLKLELGLDDLLISKHSLYINCGGKEVMIGDKKYEADREQRGASMYYMGENWAFSSTGNFMDNDADSDTYIETNTSALSKNVSALDSELYMTARASPISLTYYGLCLINGNYTVRLHFAEIVFTNDRTFYSLGKRVFDVYIQDKLVLKDFDIASEAGDVGKPIVKAFTSVVSSHTLKIHFYWAGKGTTGIPDRGFYGPLISAISVDPNFKPPSVDGHKNRLVKVVGGVAGALVLLLLLVLGIMRKKGCLGGKIAADKECRCTVLPFGYMAPEYAMRGYLTDKADVYSFGVVALEIVSGKSNTNYRPKEEFVYLLDWAYVLQERGSLLELVDPALGSEYSSEETMVVLNVALLCTNASPTLRPTMTQVVSMLEGRTAVQDLLSDPGFSAINSKFRAIRNHFWQHPSCTQSMSTNGPKTDTSGSYIETEESADLLRVGSLTSVKSDE
ncbi:hypothetical protein DVH24_032717 [Malus domestica]|uniref:non-specific serine/threonine protein kinase n=1 Tax=Malus domestica TaxID=3750 RepID=A0A498J4D9_MALDO|nr:hypothetical protein DVH24_032717 [Malus domestica]